MFYFGNDKLGLGNTLEDVFLKKNLAKSFIVINNYDYTEVNNYDYIQQQ